MGGREGTMRLAQVGQHADDLDRAADFYTELLSTPPTGRFEPPGLLFFDLDGVRLLLERGLPSATLYLAVDDVHEALERVRGRAEVVSEPRVIFHHDDDRLGPSGSDEWHAFIRDPEGNLVGLVSWTAH
jgi:predicted enzyme related to lactoylglutathione lyase